MRMISWNVNGLRACLQKGFGDFFHQADADIFCLQETKMQEGQVALSLNGYQQYWNSAQKKGYSGTAVFSRVAPASVTYGMGDPLHDTEGRLITLEYPDFYLINVYTPNAQRGLTRLAYRMQWEDDFRKFVQKKNTHKPVIICGDMNVAHQEIDLKNPKSNHNNAGFTDVEREKMTRLLAAGFTDSYRHLYPDRRDAYTWWSYMHQARERNIGWRIDYFLVSDILREEICGTNIYADITGSDHCPVELTIF